MSTSPRPHSSRKANPESVPAWHTAFGSLSELKRHAVCIGLLMVLAVAFFAPIHFSGKTLVATDTVQWRAMAESMFEAEEATGEAALWAGRVFAGMPGYMISPELTVPQVDLVMRELRKLMWPTSHMWLLLIGMYLLAFRLTRESLSATVAAVAYGFTTYIPVILAAGHNSKYVALAWAPWMLLAFVNALDRRTIGSGLLFAVALAANLRAGHVQITYYVTMAAGIWWLVEAAHAFRGGDRTAFLKGTGVLVLGSILGLMMVAQPYLSHAEVAPHTTRGAAVGGGEGGMGWEYAMAWSQGPGELLTLLVADAYGGASPTYWGPKTFTGGPHYLGAITLFLMILAFWRVCDRQTLSLSISVLAMILFALGENLPLLNQPMFDFFPMFSAFRVPETWLSIMALLAALMAAKGLAWLFRDGVAFSGSLTSQSWFRVAAALGVVLLALNVLGTSLFDFEKPGERAQIETQIQRSNPGVSMDDPRVVQFIDQQLSQFTQDRIDAFSGDAMRSLLVLVAVALLMFLLQRGTLPSWLTGFLLVLIVTIDLPGVARRHVNEDRLSPAPDPKASVPEYGFDRFLQERRDAEGGEGSFRVLSLEGGQHPAQNARPSFYYESLGGYSAAKLRVYQDFLDEILFGGPTGINPAALDMLDVKYVVASGGLAGFRPVFEDEGSGQVVWENQDLPGRAWLVDSVAVHAGPEAVWSELVSPLFEPARVGHVREGVVDAAALSGPAGEARVDVDAYQAEHMTFQVSTDRDRLMVISEVYYEPGWVARIDGVETDVVQVDHLLRGVVVPAGSHTVELEFDPPSHRQGVWIAGLGTGVTYGWLLILGVMAWMRRRKETATA